MSRRRLETDEATTVRTTPGRDDELPAGLLPSLDDHAGPARRLASSKSAAMVASIVEAAMRDAPPISIDKPQARPEKSEIRPLRSSAPRRLVPLLAAALVAAAVVGAAAAVITTRYFTPAQAPKASPPSAPAAPAPAPIVTPDVPAEIEMEASAPIESKPRRKPAPPPRDKVLPPDAPPEDVLALANQRRKERAWRDADELYRRVLKSHPRSDAAIVAEVASATIHLEHLKDPAGALAGYRHALRARPAGALGEEARWGIAEAYRARGDAKQEATALRVYLAAHPGSAMASAAKKRLAELAR